MKVPGKVNQVRRKLLQSLAKNIGKRNTQVKFRADELPEIKRILISRPNGRLGNLLLVTPLLQDVIATFPDCKIDILVKGGLGPTLFKNYNNVERIIELPKKPFSNLVKYIASWISLRQNKYDLVINVTKNSSSGRLSTQFSNAKLKFFGDVSSDFICNEEKHIAKYPVHNYRQFLTEIGFPTNNKTIPALNLKLTEEELEHGKLALNEIIDSSKKTICIFTNATGGKCYTEEWWETFYESLLKKYPDYNIIEVLPVENISRINFKAPTYYSQNVREIGALIANTALFIGADSGIMHLASSVNTPTLGLFSVTPLEVYEPYNDRSLGIKTCNCSAEDLMKVAAGVMAIGLRMVVFLETQITF